jgi:hypothetical protein
LFSGRALDTLRSGGTGSTRITGITFGSLWTFGSSQPNWTFRTGVSGISLDALNALWAFGTSRTRSSNVALWAFRSLHTGHTLDPLLPLRTISPRLTLWTFGTNDPLRTLWSLWSLWTGWTLDQPCIHPRP